MIGSVLLLEFSVIEGRRLSACVDCGLLLRSVCDLAAGRAWGSATGIGVVALRLLLVVLRLRLPPSSLEFTSR